MVKDLNPLKIWSESDLQW